MGWGNLLCYMATCFHVFIFHHKVVKRYIFTKVLPKDSSNPANPPKLWQVMYSHIIPSPGHDSDK